MYGCAVIRQAEIRIMKKKLCLRILIGTTISRLSAGITVYYLFFQMSHNADVIRHRICRFKAVFCPGI